MFGIERCDCGYVFATGRIERLQSSAPPAGGSVGKGVRIGLLINFGGFLILRAIGDIGIKSVGIQRWSSSTAAQAVMILLLVFGLTQMLGIIPACIYVRNERETMKGVLIAAGITFMLNVTAWAGCWFILRGLGGFRR